MSNPPRGTETPSALPDLRLVRNVALVGPVSSGKTTLVEALLVEAGRVATPNSLPRSDSSPLAVATLAWQGVVVNLIDTRGSADVANQIHARSGLRAAEAALFVVSAAHGVDPATGILWQECADAGMPRAVVVTCLDSPRADFDEMVAICRRVFGDDIVPFHLPLADDNGHAAGTLNLISQRITDHSAGGRDRRSGEPEHRTLSEDARNDLLGVIITETEHDDLAERLLAGEDVEESTLMRELGAAVARGSLHPAFATALTPAGLGASDVLDLIVLGFPSPEISSPRW